MLSQRTCGDLSLNASLVIEQHWRGAAKDVLCALYFRAALEVWGFKETQSFGGNLPLVKLSVFYSDNSSVPFLLVQSQSFAVRLSTTAELCLQPSFYCMLVFTVINTNPHRLINSCPLAAVLIPTFLLWLQLAFPLKAP